MQKKYIETLAEVLEIDLQKFNGMTQAELLEMLEEMQAREVHAIA